MNKKHSLFLACIMMLLSFSLFGQDKALFVTPKGALIDFPWLESYSKWFSYPPSMLPITKKGVKTITINKYELVDSWGELRRKESDNGYKIIINYDSLSGKINKIEDNEYAQLFDFQYKNNKIVGYNVGRVSEVRYTYDENGLLKSAMENGGKITYKYKHNNDGSINVEEYDGTYHKSSRICLFDAMGRKTIYMYLGKRLTKERISPYDITILDADIRYNYNVQNQLTTIKIKKRTEKVTEFYSRDYYDTKIENSNREIRFEYGKDGNVSRSVEYAIGDIAVMIGGYDYEYIYTYYMTEEEVRLRAEEQKRIAEQKRKADSIQEVERKRLQAEQQRIDSLKTAYSSCKYLFKTETHFTSCMKKEQADMELEIMKLIDNKVLEIFTKYVKTGKELRDPYGQAHIEIKRIRYICNNVDNQSITSHTEDELAKFIASYKTLTKAYKKAVGKKPSEFLMDYINQN